MNIVITVFRNFVFRTHFFSIDISEICSKHFAL